MKHNTHLSPLSQRILTTLATCVLLILSLPVAHAQYTTSPNPANGAANIGQSEPLRVNVFNIGTDTTTPMTAIATIVNTDEWTIIGSNTKTITTSTYFDLQFLPQTTSGQDTGSLSIMIGGYEYVVALRGTVLPMPHYS